MQYPHCCPDRQLCVTNVVKPARFQSPCADSCYKRRQSAPKNLYFQRISRWIDDVCNNAQESTQKTPWIDDVCNNAQPNIPSSLQPPISTSGPTGTEGAGRPRGPGCGARGRWRGLAGLRGDAPSEARCADGSRAGRRPRRSLAQRGHKQSPEQRHNKQRGVRSASAPRTPSVSVAHRLS